MKVEVFPTLLYRYHLDDQDPIKARVEEFYKEHKFNTNTPDQWNCNLFTSYGSSNFPIGECLDAFTPTLDEFQTESQSYGSMILTDLWLNVYEAQNWQEKHIHSPGQWSGVYYVHFDPNEHKATNFYHPCETLLATAGITQNTVVPWVQEGDMIIFPSWLEHAAPMNKSSKMRSTISFNFFIEEEINEGGNTDTEESIIN
jgi:uncharacterized protein (TIGR02466 family)|tara:strand:+ start:84 stop:683 length:600 start_codon:yes stop_codon:yes gene_type:complete